MNLIKKLCALALAACAIGAQAQQTVTLQPMRCAAYWCSGVPNSAGDDILVYWSPQYGQVGVYLNGDPYEAALGRNAPATVSGQFSGVVLTDANGKQIILTLATHEWVICGGSGRGGGYCHPQTAILSGSLVVYP